MMSLGENVKLVTSLVPATRSSSATGTGVDTMGFNTLMAIVHAGDIDTASGDETYAIKLQEADTDSESYYSDITSATATVTADNDLKKIKVENLVGIKRYVRAILTIAGTSPSMPGTVIIALGNPVSIPQT